ncbi:hypothetical protein ACEQPO_01725 [Bacillus sp. SL00103]
MSWRMNIIKQQTFRLLDTMSGSRHKAVDYLIQSGRKSIGFCFDTESSEARNRGNRAILTHFLHTDCRYMTIGCSARRHH